MRCKGGYARLILFRSSGDHGWKGRGHVRVENSQPPPQNDQSFHVTRHARVHLGGASTQIVFQPVFTSSDMQLEEGEHNYYLQFSGRSYVLYQDRYFGVRSQACADTHSSAGVLYVDVAGREAGGGGREPVSCEAAAESCEHQRCGDGRGEEGDRRWRRHWVFRGMQPVGAACIGERRVRRLLPRYAELGRVCMYPGINAVLLENNTEQHPV